MIDRRSSPLSTRWVCFLLSLVAGPTFASDEASEWLARMDKAVETLNYRGNLVHVNGGTVSIVEIVHRASGDQISERITSLDGNPREIIRNNDEVTCILPDQGVVMVENRDARDPVKSPLTGRLPTPSTLSEAHYVLALGERSRAAGRDAQIILISPRDEFRYGYRLWLDEATAMPLKSQLLDDRDRVIEELVFASIRLPEKIDADLVEPSLETSAYEWHHSGQPPDAEPGEAGTSDWRAHRLPAGFELIAAMSKMPPGSKHSMDHLVYADGLASVSVFIEVAVAAAEQAEGFSMLGAANAYTTTLDGQLVTAVGEVPPQTVEMIALSVRP